MKDQGRKSAGAGDEAPGSGVAAALLATLLAVAPFALLALLWGLDHLIR